MGDASQPLLGAFSSLLVAAHLCFQLYNPVFGDSQLHRGLMCYTERVLHVLLSRSGCMLKSRQNVLANAIQCVIALRKLNDVGWLTHYSLHWWSKTPRKPIYTV